MRTITVTILAVALMGCGGPGVTSLQHATSTPMGGNRIANALTGMAPGSPRSCLPTGRWTTETLGGGALAFRDGSQLFIGSFVGGCPQSEQPGVVLVSKGMGPSACEGDFVQAVDASSGQTYGHCVMGPFIPYQLGRKFQ
jgi:hypothetical protein